MMIIIIERGKKNLIRNENPVKSGAQSSLLLLIVIMQKNLKKLLITLFTWQHWAVYKSENNWKFWYNNKRIYNQDRGMEFGLE